MIETCSVESLPTITNKGGRGHASDGIKVGYKFPPNVVNILNILVEEKPDLDKSAFIARLIDQWFAGHSVESSDTDHREAELVPRLKIASKTERLLYFGNVVLSVKFVATRHRSGLLGPCRKFLIPRLIL